MNATQEKAPQLSQVTRSDTGPMDNMDTKSPSPQSAEGLAISRRDDLLAKLKDVENREGTVKASLSQALMNADEQEAGQLENELTELGKQRRRLELMITAMGSEIAKGRKADAMTRFTVHAQACHELRPCIEENLRELKTLIQKLDNVVTQPYEQLANYFYHRSECDRLLNEHSLSNGLPPDIPTDAAVQWSETTRGITDVLYGCSLLFQKRAYASSEAALNNQVKMIHARKL